MSKAELIEIGVPDEAAGLIEDFGNEHTIPVIATPEGLRQWIDAGNSLSKAIKGIGPKTEKVVIETLEADADANVQADADVESDAQADVENDTVADATATDDMDPPDAESIESDVEVDADADVQADADVESDAQAGIENDTVTDATAVDDDSDEVEYITIELPVGPSPDDNYETQQARGGRLSMRTGSGRHLQLQLAPDEAMFFLRVREGMRLTNMRRSDGRPAWDTPDVQRIIAKLGIEQLE